MNLSTFIMTDLKSRILCGKDLPESLALMDLSQHYQVSITPVRNAVQELVDEGFIEKLPNKRLRINPDRIGIGHPDSQVEAPPARVDWAETLLNEVMHESLRRQAVYLREYSLSVKYGIGRSVIRQVFSRFAGGGLLEHVPRRGWLVRPFREEDMEAYLVVREALELKALDLARDRLDKSDLESILARDVHALNNALHRYLVEKSGNRYIRDFFSQYVARYYTKLFHYAAPEAAAIDEMTSQHQGILEALLAGAWPQARSLLSKHIRAQRTILKTLLIDGRSIDQARMRARPLIDTRPGVGLN